MGGKAAAASQLRAEGRGEVERGSSSSSSSCFPPGGGRRRSLLSVLGLGSGGAAVWELKRRVVAVESRSSAALRRGGLEGGDRSAPSSGHALFLLPQSFSFPV